MENIPSFKEFMENYPLYSKFTTSDFPKIRNDFVDLLNSAINKYCISCKTVTTFLPNGSYGKSRPSGPIRNEVLELEYRCAQCGRSAHFYILEINAEKECFIKHGQYPPWDISIDKDIQKYLGPLTGFYKNAKISESQGYGIAACIYYRRIIEDLINSIIERIPSFLTDEENTKYQSKLLEIKRSKNAESKIEIIKDIIPPILRPNGLNPLKIIHDKLSVNIHSRSEDENLEDALIFENAIIFLVKTINQTSEEHKQFQNVMKKLQKMK